MFESLQWFPKILKQLKTQLSRMSLFDSSFISSEKKRRFLQFKLISPSALLNKTWYNTKWDRSAANDVLKCFSDYNCHLVYLYTGFNSECVSCF